MFRKIAFEYKFVSAYLIIGGLWILFSDHLIHSLISDPDFATQLQTYKGWFFVVITALIFYYFLKEYLIKVRNAELKAIESDKLKTAFLQNISHEIRTPMNGIIGFTQLLGRDNLSDEQKKIYLDTIVSSSNQLLSIVNDVIDISLIQSGNIMAKNEPVDINEILNDLYRTYTPIINKDINLVIKRGLQNDECIIYTDKVKLRQILNNLLSNAKKFTPKGQITLGYTLKESDIEFYIEDTGIGIAPALQEKIFDRFMQAEVELTRHYGGTGLGLSICKGNLELLKGKIWVKSTINSGSTFYFTIPYLPIKKTSNFESETNINSSIYKNDTILIVEDEEVNYIYIKELLRNKQINLLYARNGKEAVEKCMQNNAISLVLMDLKMPIMNGYESLIEIRKTKPSLIIIAQTAFALIDDKEKALAAGFNDYLAKPFTEKQLITLISKYIPRNSN